MSKEKMTAVFKPFVERPNCSTSTGYRGDNLKVYMGYGLTCGGHPMRKLVDSFTDKFCTKSTDLGRIEG